MITINGVGSSFERAWLSKYLTPQHNSFLLRKNLISGTPSTKPPKICLKGYDINIS